MTKRRTLGVLILLLTFTVPDLLACGDKFLVGPRGTRFQRPKGAPVGSVLIYAEPKSAMAAAIKKDDTEKVLKLAGHHVKTVKTLQNLSTLVSNGHYDVILTSNADLASVQRLIQGSSDAAKPLSIDDLLKSRTILEEIDKEVVQRDQNRKKK